MWACFSVKVTDSSIQRKPEKAKIRPGDISTNYWFSIPSFLEGGKKNIKEVNNYTLNKVTNHGGAHMILIWRGKPIYVFPNETEGHENFQTFTLALWFTFTLEMLILRVSWGQEKKKKKGKREERRREKQEAQLLGGSLTPEEDFPKLSPRRAPMGIAEGIVGICLRWGA